MKARRFRNYIRPKKVIREVYVRYEGSLTPEQAALMKARLEALSVKPVSFSFQIADRPRRPWWKWWTR